MKRPPVCFDCEERETMEPGWLAKNWSVPCGWCRALTVFRRPDDEPARVHDPTGDERHGDWEYGAAFRVELDDLGRECVYGGTCEPRSDDPDTCVECGRPR